MERVIIELVQVVLKACEDSLIDETYSSGIRFGGSKLKVTAKVAHPNSLSCMIEVAFIDKINIYEFLLDKCIE